ncbi:DnaA ATPase domain-containing protein [Metabacillus halosaccharovorans]|uniref:DnaA ATPase domain-containing protein n=1 Tax=Metabacillus halosaccharovorans TaxID=930124 RepID=UPI003736BE92
MFKGNDQWADILEVLKKNMSAPSFETWFNSTTAKIENHTWNVIAVNEFSRDWLESRYLLDIENAIYQVTGELTEVRIIVEHPSFVHHDGQKVETMLEQIKSLTSSERVRLFSSLKHSYGKELQLSSEGVRTNLNQNLTFGTFVEKEKNRLAFTASKAVADAPGKAYNPLFLYGSGTDKSHLLQAIGNFILEQNPLEKVAYITAEQFLNECIKNNIQRTANIGRYQDADVLLFDNVQQLAEDIKSQEEFFHLFNMFYEKSKQIVITSDCHPEELSILNEHLQSRFGWGLIIAASLEDSNDVTTKKKEEDRYLYLEYEIKEIKKILKKFSGT